MNAEVRPFRRRRLTPEDGRQAAWKVLATPIQERREKARELFLDDPETLLPLLEVLRAKWESDPAYVYQESLFLYTYLESLSPKYPVDAFLLDEREYFLGETARIIGTVCRDLTRRDEARQWLDLSEGWFLLTENAAGNISKVTYQRLALRIEERDFEPVSKQLPQLVASFRRLEMWDDALKARFLEANILRETDRLAAALQVFNEIALEARDLHNDALLSHAYVNLVQINALLGNQQEAVSSATRATPILRRLGNRIGLAKLQWGVGYLLRSQGNGSGAIDAYRTAQREFVELDMRADVAAVHLVIADLLLDNGQEKQAEWEVRQALPVIDEYKLVPEGFAALTLLRESVRRQKIDRQALRNLHGYFEELSA
jgi:tetratricopeptide (TPR) repeat protein